MARVRRKAIADFVNDRDIADALRYGAMMATESNYIRSLINKAVHCERLNHREAAVLLQVEDEELLEEIRAAAANVKVKIYGKSIVLSASLPICNDWCEKLAMDQLSDEVRTLLQIGHKRLTLETGHEPGMCSVDFVIQCMDKIYSVQVNNSSIRKVNVKFPAAEEADYRRLAEAGIGTYLLLQGTYHRPTYERLQQPWLKQDFDWQTTAMDRALRSGIDDVGIGVLYGLYEYKYETIALLLHAEHLDVMFGVGPHSVSIPRLKAENGFSLAAYPHLVNDRDYLKLISVLRLAFPYTGITLSAMNEPELRDEAVRVGVSHFHAGCCPEAEEYIDQLCENDSAEHPEFEIGDQAATQKLIKRICQLGSVPSFCTACFQEGRTGRRFLKMARNGKIHNACQFNSLLTFKEYLMDYGDEEIRIMGEEVIRGELMSISKQSSRRTTAELLNRIETGERNLKF